MANKKGIYYHGTSADHLQSIMKEGLQPVPGIQRIWSGSLPNHVYLWDDSKTEFGARESAIDSGSCAIVLAKDPRIIVIKVEAPIDMFFDDTSGENMAGQGAVATWDVPFRYITQIEISENLACLVASLTKSCMRNPSFRGYLLSDIQKVAAEATEHVFMFDHDIKFETYYVKDKNISRNRSRQYM